MDKRIRIVVTAIASILICYMVLSFAGNSIDNALLGEIWPTPTPDPTATPAFVPVTAPAVLGQPIGAFVARYGQPDNASYPGSGNYAFRLYPDSDPSSADDLEVNLLPQSAAESQWRSVEISMSAQNEWDQLDASRACSAFAPHDANYLKEEVLYDADQNIAGVALIYSSAELLRLFPADAFLDAVGKQVPGEFSIAYWYGADTSQFARCTLSLGDNPNPDQTQ